jgi:uncharacterized protein YcbK (DUF882 family)
MKTKYLNLMSLAASLLFLTACDSSSANDLATPPGKVCYESTCTSIIDAAKIVDPKNEYKYPRKEKFPDSNSREQYRAPYAFIDLLQVHGDTPLSKSLRLKDFASTQKGRYALVLPSLVKNVESIHSSLGAGLRITSGYRSPGYNSDIKDSATWSRHTYGDAVDMQHSTRSLKQLRAACIASKASFYLMYAKHIHCDWRTVALDPAFYPPAPEGAKTQSLEQNELAMTKGSQIVYEKINQTITLATVLPLIDLEGPPTHHWQITSPTGEVYESDEPQFIFEPNEYGAYYVEVKVGDFFKITSRFNW